MTTTPGVNLFNVDAYKGTNTNFEVSFEQPKVPEETRVPVGEAIESTDTKGTTSKKADVTKALAGEGKTDNTNLSNLFDKVDNIDEVKESKEAKNISTEDIKVARDFVSAHKDGIDNESDDFKSLSPAVQGYITAIAKNVQNNNSDKL